MSQWKNIPQCVFDREERKEKREKRKEKREKREEKREKRKDEKTKRRNHVPKMICRLSFQVIE